MNRAEAVALAQLVRAARPHQTWNEHTPDAWALSLLDVRVEDAREVLPTLFASADWVTPAAIRDAALAMRAARIDKHASKIPPPPDPDDVAGSLAWNREWLRAIGDGQVPPDLTTAAVQAMPDLQQLLPSKAASPTGRRAVAHTNPALTVGCPWCGALPNQRCVTASGPVAWLHEARQGAAPPSRKVST